VALDFELVPQAGQGGLNAARKLDACGHHALSIAVGLLTGGVDAALPRRPGRRPELAGDVSDDALEVGQRQEPLDVDR
jgi:hypothetical protein